MSPEIAESELCDRYSELYTGLLTDVLEEHGLEDQTLDNSITPLSREMRTAGIAYPVVGRPNRSIDGDENLRRIVQMLTDAPPNTVLMYNTNGSPHAQIGELSVSALKTKGCRGAVLDGGARDVPLILEKDFPVFTHHSTPEGANIRWQILDWDVATEVGGVRVEPGDVVVGDIDGIVVVPEELSGDVLREAEALRDTEDQIRDTVRDGMSPRDAFEKYGSF